MRSGVPGRQSGPSKPSKKRRSAFSLVEVLLVIAVIAALAFGIPAITRVLSAARSSSVSWQERAVNDAYANYLAQGGAPGMDLTDALTKLRSDSRVTISPPLSMTGADGTQLLLTFNDQVFSYQPVQAAPTPRPSPTPSATASLTMNVSSAGGTATYGGQDFGVGRLPSFMLRSAGGRFEFHNTGGFEGVPVWSSLDAFVAEIPVSPDRFNPVATKALVMSKDGVRYDLNFATWRHNGVLNLRLVSVSRY